MLRKDACCFRSFIRQARYKPQDADTLVHDYRKTTKKSLELFSILTSISIFTSPKGELGDLGTCTQKSLHPSHIPGNRAEQPMFSEKIHG
jgi:hypothetical protein